MSKARYQYVLVIRTNLDELPIGIYQHKGRAIAAINKMTRARIEKAAKLMGVDSAGVVNAAIITFANASPISMSLHELPLATTGDEQ